MSARRLKVADYIMATGGIILQILCPAYFVFIGFQVFYVTLLLPLLFVSGILLTSTALARTHENEVGAYFWMYFAFGFCLPIYGGLGALFIAVYADRTTEADQDVMSEIQEGYSYSDVQSEILNREEILVEDDETRLRRELMVQPYIDIMRGPNRNLKKSLITKIIGGWTRHGVDLLKTALADIDYDIRSYAATGLRGIEDQMGEKMMTLRDRLRSEPQNVEVKLQLAWAYLFMVRKGIADPSLSDHYLQVCDTLLKEAEPYAQGSESSYVELLSVRSNVARLSGNTELEGQLYAQILKRDPRNVETLAGLCYLQFEKRDFAALRETAHRFLSATPGEHPLNAAAQLWVEQS